MKAQSLISYRNCISYLLYSFKTCIIVCASTYLFIYWMIFQLYMNTYFCFLRKANKLILMNSYISFFIRRFYQLYFFIYYISVWLCFFIFCIQLINASFHARLLICLGIGWFFSFTWIHISAFGENNMCFCFLSSLDIFINYNFIYLFSVRMNAHFLSVVFI